MTLSATGATPLALRALHASADFLLGADCPALIAAGASCAISVRFAPQQPGDRSSTLTVDTSAGTLTVAGTATLKRGRHVVARGHARDGLVTLSSAKTLAKGRYTLTVTGLDASGRPRTQRATVRID